jgi:hypothetical protein
MNATHKSKQQENPSTVLWMAALVIILTSLVLDAAALAWSASVLDGRQVTAAIFTFVLVLTGAAVTVWKMKID